MALSQRAHDVKMTSCQRQCDVITSHRRRYNVILAPNARWDEARIIHYIVVFSTIIFQGGSEEGETTL